MTPTFYACAIVWKGDPYNTTVEMSTSSSLSAEAEVPPVLAKQETASPPFSPREEAAGLPEERRPPPPDLREPEVGIIQNRGAFPAGFPRLGGPQSNPTLRSRVTQAFLMTPLYPMRFVHVLIQLGYEPVPPERRYSIVFQRYMYYWPGLIGYARAIARKDGWMELYRGVTGNLASEITAIVASSLLSPVVKEIVGKIPLSVVPSNGDTPDNEDNIETTRAILVRGVRLFCNQLIVRSAVIIIRQPLFTINVRMIAQHVGKESLYDSGWSSVLEIYHREGVAGFYKGVVPALLGGVLSTVMHVTLWVGLELIAKMITQDVGKTLIKGLVRPFLISYVPRSYAYPFELMRAVMSANDSGLQIGTQPYMPRFSGWKDCYRHLKAQHVMYRGSVFYLSRYAYTEKP